MPETPDNVRVISGPSECRPLWQVTTVRAPRGRGIGECANRTLRLGLSRCKLVFLEAVFTSRDGRVCVGANAPAFPQVLKVGIANESDQVT